MTSGSSYALSAVVIMVLREDSSIPKRTSARQSQLKAEESRKQRHNKLRARLANRPRMPGKGPTKSESKISEWDDNHMVSTFHFQQAPPPHRQYVLPQRSQRDWIEPICYLRDSEAAFVQRQFLD